MTRSCVGVFVPFFAASAVVADDEPQRLLDYSSSDVVVAVAAVQKLLPSAAFEQCTPLSGAHDLIEPQRDASIVVLLKSGSLSGLNCR
jgi:hypothetical protein